MDSTVDPVDELRDLTRQLRAQLRRHLVLGAWAAPGGATAAYVGRAAAEAAEAAEAAGAAGAADAADAADAVDLRPVLSGAAEEAIFAEPALSGAVELIDLPDMNGPGETAAETTASAAGFEGAAPAPRARDAAHPSLFDPEPVDPEQLISLGRRTLAQVREELGDCKRCKLHSTRRNIVFGVGAEDAPLMFVGEAPGEQEDKRGEPFVGPAGELLNKMIEAMGWTRETVYIANTTKCRPPENRNPQPDELQQCTPFLDAQIRAIAPRIIVTLGRPAANHVLRKDAPISALRGRFHDRAGVRVMPTFHPAYLLRDPDKKKETWSDLKQVIAELERLGITPPHPPRG